MQQQGYPNQGGYPPQQAGYPPQQAGYPPQQGGYPPQQGGYPPQQGGYPPQQGGYPPPPPQGGYPPQGPYQQQPQPPMGNPHMPPMEMYPMNNHGPVITVKTGFQKLQESQGIFIKQKFEVLEAVTGCETPNVYKVYPADTNGSKIGSKTIFKCKEKSGCCARQFCAGDCRPFNMKVSNEDGAFINGNLEKSLFLHMERPFKCTCMCFNRPQMSVLCLENGMNKFLGKIKNPCYFCSIGVNIEDAAGNLKYMIEGTQCQIGYLCMGFPCKACQEVFFDVKDASGATVTRLLKKSAGCLKACVGDADNFSLGFPQGATPDDKALLLAATLFIDYMYFENKQQNANSGID